MKEKEAENARLVKRVRDLEFSQSAAEAECERRLRVERELRVDDRRNDRHHLAAAKAAAKTAANLAEWERSKSDKQIATLRGQVLKQMEIAEERRQKMLKMTDADEVAVLADQIEAAARVKQTLEDRIVELESNVDVLAGEAEETAAVVKELTAGPSRGQHADANAAAHLKTMKEDVGVPPKYVSVPAREAHSADEKKASTRHMAAVLKGRGEGDNVNLVADALQRCGYIEPLLKAKRMVGAIKAEVRSAVRKVQDHWTPLHAVHVWDRLELSRDQMETLRHLLSFVYNPTTNKYEPIMVWENPTDSTDFVLAARLAGRTSREGKYREIAKTMNIEVGVNGRCERDFVECASLLYTKYAKALRQNYSPERPAQPVLFLDGTGGPLGTGICHGEVGCADFIAVGDSDAKQSRATLQPLFLYAGNDHALPLRANLELSVKTYNALVHDGVFDRVTLSGDKETLPARPITAADMQGAKTTYGMRECPHSVWCKCQRGEGGPQFRFPDEDMKTYEEMIHYVDNVVGCELKTFDEMCGWAHYSPGVARGGKFTGFTCSCCGYSPTEARWKADLVKWHAMSDEEHTNARKTHMDGDDPLHSHFQHYHQELYLPPLPHHGMDRCGADDLHLIFLNMFKHYFKYTVHESLPKSKKELIAAYCKAQHFYSYDAKSEDEDPTSHWIGREVKRFISEADVHLPFLLRVAAAPADCIPDIAECANGNGEQQMDFDPEYAPTEEDIAQEEEEEPLMMENAARWDNFLELVRASQKPWPQGEADTIEYRRTRRLEAFNLGTRCCRDLVALKVTMKTWVPHILAYVRPRQMEELGDPQRRSCDACESFGAMTKKLIKHSTCRRRLGAGAVEHKKKVSGTAATRRWKQTFTVGYIQQAFTRACVREALRHGEENAPFLQRIDAIRANTGVAGTQKMKFDDSPVAPMRSIYELVKEREEQGCSPSAA